MGRVKNGALDLQKIIRSMMLHVRSNSIYESREVDINSIIISELEFFKINPVFKHEIEKQVDLFEPAPIIFGNPVQIKQIVDNLITNAIDAMEVCSPKQLSVATRVQNSHVELSVADTGEGIDTDDITRIFSPDFTTKPAGKGTGLGLASVKTMVDAYNGSISVESQKGQGAIFSVRLPVAAGPGFPAA
jgi:signal transduction histidine kinase